VTFGVTINHLVVRPCLQIKRVHIASVDLLTELKSGVRNFEGV